MKFDDVIIGSISGVDTVDGHLSKMDVVEGDVLYIKDATIYDGEYDVVPLAFSSTTLPTNGRKLDRDIVVQEIPYYETGNDSGGYTVYIAKE